MPLKTSVNATPTVAEVRGFTYDGRDYSTLKPDGTFGLSFRVIHNSKRVIAEHIARRWICEQGDLDAAYIGAGFRRYLNMSLTVMQREQLEAALRNEALNVDGVERCSVAITQKRLSGSAFELTASATVTLSRRFGGETFTTVFALTAETSRLIVGGQIT